jgi:hypothetical protein
MYLMNLKGLLHLINTGTIRVPRIMRLISIRTIWVTKIARVIGKGAIWVVGFISMRL